MCQTHHQPMLWVQVPQHHQPVMCQKHHQAMLCVQVPQHHQPVMCQKHHQAMLCVQVPQHPQPVMYQRHHQPMLCVQVPQHPQPLMCHKHHQPMLCVQVPQHHQPVMCQKHHQAMLSVQVPQNPQPERHHQPMLCVQVPQLWLQNQGYQILLLCHLRPSQELVMQHLLHSHLFWQMVMLRHKMLKSLGMTHQILTPKHLSLLCSGHLTSGAPRFLHPQMCYKVFALLGAVSDSMVPGHSFIVCFCWLVGFCWLLPVLGFHMLFQLCSVLGCGI